ncbi:uncharacterized protein LOC119081247 [Bradysia coprophila]|uniref:uncharacterized protein LOC119081247 n=1 Tax=Bradysia coprophila TaxID=38358 RepID=UPI00187DD0C5|nr:uncharacterized protein LOC119081247 [Bradysia coprophila]
MSNKTSELCITSLNETVLLRIFKLLNWIDSINLSATCKRMKNINFWLSKQNEEFDFNGFVENATVPIGNILPVIGPYIRVAKISEQEIRELFMVNCCNIKSLKIDGSISRSAAITLNTWLKQLKIESLSIGQTFEDHVEELLNGIEGLRSFVFDSFQKLLPEDFFNQNTSIRHLLLILGDSQELSLDLSSLQVLHSLQSLSITTERTTVLIDVRKYVKIEQLQEFSINILDDNWDACIWDDFATYLAENSKVDKLRMNGCIDIDHRTCSTLNSFNLKSLWLDVSVSWEDFTSSFRESAMPRLKYLRLEWPISWCRTEKIGRILDIWPTVEAICLNVQEGSSNLIMHFKDEFYADLLKRYDNRPGSSELRIHIFSSEISFNFVSKRYNVIEGKECCSCKESFQLWDDDRVKCNL